jgi:hypothetical protein
VLTDGGGAPIGVAAGGANTPGMRLVQETLERAAAEQLGISPV